MFDDVLSGQVALITGSTYGVGLASAEAMGRAGARVVILNGRNEQAGAEACAKLAAIAPDTQFHFVRADMNSLTDIEALFAQTKTLAGGLDIFVHCGYGGGAAHAPDIFTNQTPENSAATVNSILISLINCCHFAAPLLIERGAGSILGITSDAAKVPTPGESVHGAALAGSVMFLRTLARELGRHKIRVNGVTPSLIRDTRNYETVMAGGFSQKLFESIEKRALLGVPGPENLAPLITFLSSSYASHITGQIVSVNGGISGA
ncbi:MAG: SDR family oxidoreductase [Spongiibacteraceae bacterium]